MPVMTIEVPGKYWNDVQMASIRLGLDSEPDVPSQDGSTSVEMSGSITKLQAALLMCRKGVAFISVSARTERSTKLDTARAFEMLENRARINRGGQPLRGKFAAANGYSPNSTAFHENEYADNR